MNQQIVYVVMGETGEYSDYTCWSVCAYANEAQAEQHAQLAQARADEVFPNRYESGADLSNPYDPRMQMEYTGTKYLVNAVPFMSGEAIDFPTWFWGAKR